MRKVGLFEAKAKLSELCDQVAASDEPILITRRGKPVVRIEPLRGLHTGRSIWRTRDAFLGAGGTLDEELVIPARHVDPSEELFE